MILLVSVLIYKGIEVLFTECINEKEQCTYIEGGYQGCTYTSQYLGTKNTTVKGFPCQYWSRNKSPQEIEPNLLQETVQRAFHLDKNHCRLAGKDYPWCYTQSGPDIFDYCFPKCQAVNSTNGMECVLILISQG